MSKQEFMDNLKKSIEAFLGEETEVIVNQVTKNNGVILEGITITKKDCNISPTIYVDDFYEEYAQGKEFGRIIKEIIDIYHQCKVEHNIDLSFLLDYENVKNKIVYKLINFEKNKLLLAQVPHVKYLDLAIVFYCNIVSDFLNQGSILIYNKYCKTWKITTEQLYDRAKQNTPKLLRYDLKSMEQIMRDMIDDNGLSSMQENSYYDKDGNETTLSNELMEDMIQQILEELEEGKTEIPMYVLSNEAKLNGAACLLYADIVKNFADTMKSDLYILPSSIHEIIIVPADENNYFEKLEKMVKDVNATQVCREDVLSDGVYFYSRQLQEIVQCFG